MPAPTDITGLTHRFRASKLGLSDGSLIAAAAFETGGITMAQSSFANQPTYVASSIGGQPAMRFNGSTSWIGGNNPTFINQPFTLSFVLRINYYDGNTGQEIMYTAGSELLLNNNASNVYTVSTGGSSASGGLPSVGAHAVTVVFTGSNAATVYVDGRQEISSTVGTPSFQHLRLGSFTDNSRWFNGDISEINVYNKALSAGERATLHTYIQSTYGITMADATVADAINGISGMTHRLRASKLPAYGNNASIATAAFETGGITLNQGSAGNRPTLTANSVNGNPGMTFNGSSFWLDGTVSSAMSQPFTMTVVVKLNDVSSWQEIINAGEITLYLQSNAYGFNAGSSLTGGTTSSGAHSITVIESSGGTAAIYVDGSLVATGNAGSGRVTSYSFGRNAASGRYFNGDICEYILYNRALTASELAIQDTYIQNTYAIIMADAPLTTIATDSWTGPNGAAWSSQWVSLQAVGTNGSDSIQGNAGAIFGGNNGSTFREYLAGMPSVSDIDIVVNVTIPSQADTHVIVGFDSDNTVSANGDYGNDPQNGYYLKWRAGGDQSYSTFELFREVNSSRAQIGPTYTGPFVAATSYSIHVQKLGSRLRAKYWLSSNAEPAVWNVTGSDTNSTQLTGKMYLAITYGYSATQPVLFDNLTVSSFSTAAISSSLGRYVRSKDIPSLVITASGIQVASPQSTNYTLMTSDAGRVVEMNTTAVGTVTIPPNATVAFPVGTYIDICQIGTGAANVIAGSGVTLDISQGTATYGRYSTIRLRQRAINEWVIGGAVTPFYDPTTITGLVYRMRASTIGMSVDGTAVSSVPFEVGGVTLTQGTAANQPLWRVRGRNGKPYLSFDGVDDFVSVTSGVPAYNQPVTICVAAQINNGLSSQELIKAGGIEILLNQSANTWSTYAGALINSPVVYSGVQYFTGVFGAAGSQGSIQNYTNGTLTSSGGGGGNSTGGGDIFIGTHPNTSRPLAADFYEVLIYSATLTNADLNKLHAYMQATYL